MFSKHRGSDTKTYKALNDSQIQLLAVSKNEQTLQKSLLKEECEEKKETNLTVLYFNTPFYFIPNMSTSIKNVIQCLCMQCKNFFCHEHQKSKAPKLKDDGMVSFTIAQDYIEEFFEDEDVTLLLPSLHLDKFKMSKKEWVCVRCFSSDHIYKTFGKIKYREISFALLKSKKSWIDELNSNKKIRKHEPFFRKTSTYSVSQHDFIQYVLKWKDDGTQRKQLFQRIITNRFIVQPSIGLDWDKMRGIYKHALQTRDLAKKAKETSCQEPASFSDLQDRNHLFSTMYKKIMSRWQKNLNNKVGDYKFLPTVQEQMISISDVKKGKFFSGISSSRICTIPSFNTGKCSVSLADSKKLMVAFSYDEKNVRCLQALMDGPDGVGGAIQYVRLNEKGNYLRHNFEGVPDSSTAIEWCKEEKVVWIIASLNENEHQYISRNPFDNFSSQRYPGFILRGDVSNGMAISQHYLKEFGMDFDGDQANSQALLEKPSLEYAKEKLSDEARGVMQALGKVSMPLQTSLESLCTLGLTAYGHIFSSKGYPSANLRKQFMPSEEQHVSLVQSLCLRNERDKDDFYSIHSGVEMEVIGLVACCHYSSFHPVNSQDVLQEEDYDRKAGFFRLHNDTYWYERAFFAMDDDLIYYHIRSDDFIRNRNIFVHGIGYVLAGRSRLALWYESSSSSSSSFSPIYLAFPNEKIFKKRSKKKFTQSKEEESDIVPFFKLKHVSVCVLSDASSLWKHQDTIWDCLGNFINDEMKDIFQITLADGRLFYKRDELIERRGEGASRCTFCGPQRLNKTTKKWFLLLQKINEVLFLRHNITMEPLQVLPPILKAASIQDVEFMLASVNLSSSKNGSMLLQIISEACSKIRQIRSVNTKNGMRSFKISPFLYQNMLQNFPFYENILGKENTEKIWRRIFEM